MFIQPKSYILNKKWLWSTTEEVKNVNHAVSNRNVQIKLDVIANFQYWIWGFLAVGDCAINAITQPLLGYREALWRRWLMMISPFSGDSTGGLFLALAAQPSLWVVEVHVQPRTPPAPVPPWGPRALSSGSWSCLIPWWVCHTWWKQRGDVCSPLPSPCKVQNHCLFLGKRSL